MKNIIHDLTGLCEKFILEQYSGESFRCELDLIEAANSRNIQKFTSGKIDQLEKRVKVKLTQTNIPASMDIYLTLPIFLMRSQALFTKIISNKTDRITSGSLRNISCLIFWYFH